MAHIDVVDLTGKKVGSFELADEVFGAVNEELLWEAVNHYRASLRAGTHATKVALGPNNEVAAAAEPDTAPPEQWPFGSSRVRIGKWLRLELAWRQCTGPVARLDLGLYGFGWLRRHVGRSPERPDK